MSAPPPVEVRHTGGWWAASTRGNSPFFIGADVARVEQIGRTRARVSGTSLLVHDLHGQVKVREHYGRIARDQDETATGREPAAPSPS